MLNYTVAVGKCSTKSFKVEDIFGWSTILFRIAKVSLRFTRDADWTLIKSQVFVEIRVSGESTYVYFGYESRIGF